MDIAAPRSLVYERSPMRHVDLTLVLAVVGLVASGLFMVYSATYRSLEAFNQDPGFYLKRQIAFALLGLMAMVLAAALDYHLVKIYATFVYVAFVALLILVQTPLGTPALGAQRAFLIGGFQFSPSLFSRLALVLMLAASLSQIKGEVSRDDVARAAIAAALPMVLVFIQPDIGTTIVMASILVALLVVSGAKVKYLAVLALVATVAIFGAFQLHIVKDYQIDRLTSFLDPEADPQRAGYNKQQAEIAIGAGGVFGRGYLQGTQTNLDYVPAQHTDFIFTVVGEEFGFAGAIVILVLFGVVLWRTFRIALLSKDPFGTFLAVGVGGMIAIQVFVNIGMTIGIMPITGIPLPFVSYGGSALIADFIGIGLLLNVHMRRFV
jgi:rod shape determining protein RodA